MKRLVFIILFCLMVLTPNTRDALGDVNNDGDINVLDIVRIVNIILEYDPLPSDYELWASDVNIDGSTDVSDIILIVQVILGEDDCPYLYSPCSDNMSACCPDTTSHFVNWEIDTLGAPGMYSWLNDVAVIDENNIWVVGEIHTEETDQFDSTGTWVQPYNAARWNGEEWELARIIPDNYMWGVYKTVYAINSSDVWFGSTIIVHWDGTEFIPYGSQEGYPTGLGYANKIMVLENEVFVIYDNGGITHYDGTSFIQMESGTDVTLKSITGTGPDNVWVSGDNYHIGENVHVLLHYNGEQWNTVIEGNPSFESIDGFISGVIKGVYTDLPDSVWIVTHLGLYVASDTTNGTGEAIQGFYGWGASVNEVSGISHHDIFIGGGITTIWHYNGFSFHHYDEIPYLGNIYGVSSNENTVSAAGFISSTAQVFVIRGNQN